MKQYVSVFMVMLQSIWKKLIAILAVLAVTEAALFILASRQNLWIEDIIDAGRLSWFFSAALLALTVVLSTSLSGNTRQSYTLQRLALSGRTVFCLQTLVNLTALLLLWAVQLMTALLLCKIYLSRQLASADHSLDFCQQSVFLAFYRNNFLHNLFPMESLTRWMRNLTLFAALATLTAKGTCQPQTGKKIPLMPLIAAAAVILSFQHEIGTYYMIYMDVAFTLIPIIWILSVWLNLPKEGPYVEQEPAAASELEVME